MIPSKTLLIILFLFCFTFAKAQQVPFQEGEGCLFNGKIYWNNIGTYGGTPFLMDIKPLVLAPIQTTQTMDVLFLVLTEPAQFG